MIRNTFLIVFTQEQSYCPRCIASRGYRRDGRAQTWRKAVQPTRVSSISNERKSASWLPGYDAPVSST